MVPFKNRLHPNEAIGIPEQLFLRVAAPVPWVSVERRSLASFMRLQPAEWLMEGILPSRLSRTFLHIAARRAKAQRGKPT